MKKGLADGRAGSDEISKTPSQIRGRRTINLQHTVPSTMRGTRRAKTEWQRRPSSTTEEKAKGFRHTGPGTYFYDIAGIPHLHLISSPLPYFMVPYSPYDISTVPFIIFVRLASVCLPDPLQIIEELPFPSPIPSIPSVEPVEPYAPEVSPTSKVYVSPK